MSALKVAQWNEGRPPLSLKIIEVSPERAAGHLASLDSINSL